jgi:hypothetical protein
MMKPGFAAILGFLLFFPSLGQAQNCCAPAIPQQGVLGEIVALPHTLEIGLHYELLRSRKMYEGSKIISDPANTKTQWKLATLTAAYGIFRRLGVSAIIPYAWKKKTKDFASMGLRLVNTTDGLGDITLLVRFSPLTRSFVDFRELSFGLGAKLPTGSVDERNFGFLLPEELQPGTGSWDFDGSFSYYQGLEHVDFIVSGTYLLTTSHNGYEFGNQFSYILASNFHIKDYLDFSAALFGLSRGKDHERGEDVHSTGRNQLWFTPGLKVHILHNALGLQTFYEHPLYQHFSGVQLGSDYNIRLTMVYMLQLKKSAEDDE